MCTFLFYLEGSAGDTTLLPNKVVYALNDEFESVSGLGTRFKMNFFEGSIGPISVQGR